MRVVQRLYANPITRQRKRPLSLVPNRKSKHPVQPWQTVSAPFGPGGQQDFSVGLGSEMVAFGFELLAQFAIVVDLAVERDYKTAISGEHRLMARTARVYDRKTAMAQACAAGFVTEGSGCPNTLVVTPTMLDGSQHVANACFRVG